MRAWRDIGHPQVAKFIKRDLETVDGGVSSIGSFIDDNFVGFFHRYLKSSA
jgi:hypothetical protein